MLASAYVGLGSVQVVLVNDKVLHFVDFFLLTACFYWILDTSRRRNVNVTLFVCTAVLALGSELLQALLPNGRIFDPLDILANVALLIVSILPGATAWTSSSATKVQAPQRLHLRWRLSWRTGTRTSRTPGTRRKESTRARVDQQESPPLPETSRTRPVEEASIARMRLFCGTAPCTEAMRHVVVR